MAYMIRTKSGERGPFSTDQLQELYDRGKIPQSLDVIETNSGLAVPLSDLLAADEEAGLDDWTDDDLVEASPTTEDEWRDNGEERPTRSTAPRRGSTRQAPARSPGGGRAPARSSTSGGRTPRRTSRGRYSAGASFQSKKSPVPAIIMIVILVGLVGGSVWYLGYYDKEVENLSDLYGTWVSDIDTTELEKQVAKEDLWAGKSKEEIESMAKLTASFAAGIYSQMRLELSADTLAIVFGSGENKRRVAGPYTSKKTAEGTFELRPEGTADPLTIRGQGDSLYIVDTSLENVEARFKRR